MTSPCRIVRNLTSPLVGGDLVQEGSGAVQYLKSFPFSSPATATGSTEGVNGVLFVNTGSPICGAAESVVLKKFGGSQDPVAEVFPTGLLAPHFNVPAFIILSEQDARSVGGQIKAETLEHDQAVFHFQLLFTDTSAPIVMVMERIYGRNLHDISPADLTGHAQNPKTKLLYDTGRLLAFDIFFHNTDRFPVMNEIGEASNPHGYGNKGNLMVSSEGGSLEAGSLIVIDSNIVPFVGNPSSYIEKIEKLLPVLHSEDPAPFQDLVIVPLEKYFKIKFSDEQKQEIKLGFMDGVRQVSETLTPKKLSESVETIQTKYLEGKHEKQCKEVMALVPSYFTVMHDIFTNIANPLMTETEC